MRLQRRFQLRRISPRGSLLYLIEYARRPIRRAIASAPTTSPRPATGTAGRRSARTRREDGRLSAHPRDEPGRRWAYTLYDGAGKTPFVHALDTSTRSARCIDLDALTGTNLWRLRLRPRRGRPHAHGEQRPTALVAIDTRSFRTSAPSEPAAFRWKPIAGGTAAAVAAVTALSSCSSAAAVTNLRSRIASVRAPGRLVRVPTNRQRARSVRASNDDRTGKRQEGPLRRRRTYGSVGIPHVQASERSWIRDAQNGSAEAFEHWCADTGAAPTMPPTWSCTTPPRPRTSCRNRSWPRSASLDRFDRRRPFGPWLHRIVVNRAIDWARAAPGGPRSATTSSRSVRPALAASMRSRTRSRSLPRLRVAAGATGR